MEVQLHFNLNNSLYLRDPNSSKIGKSIIKESIELMSEIGYENFTFKKLSEKINSTEATIYRYFPNKHKLLLYVLNWYWNYIYYLSQIYVKTFSKPKESLQIILKIITNNYKEVSSVKDLDLDKLHDIVIAESSKVYLVKDVDEINKDNVFMPYKNLCAYIAEIILEYAPDYKYPKSLASTLIETAHNQQFFVSHLPNLTDSRNKKDVTYVYNFLENLLFLVVHQKE